MRKLRSSYVLELVTLILRVYFDTFCYRPRIISQCWPAIHEATHGNYWSYLREGCFCTLPELVYWAMPCISNSELGEGLYYAIDGHQEVTSKTHVKHSDRNVGSRGSVWIFCPPTLDPLCSYCLMKLPLRPFVKATPSIYSTALKRGLRSIMLTWCPWRNYNS